MNRNQIAFIRYEIKDGVFRYFELDDPYEVDDLDCIEKGKASKIIRMHFQAFDFLDSCLASSHAKTAVKAFRNRIGKN